MNKKALAALALFVMLFSVLGKAMAAEEIPGRTKNLVNDYAGIIDDDIKRRLEMELGEFKRNKGVELIVSTFVSLNGRDFESFVSKYIVKWRLSPFIENDKRMHIIIVLREGKVRIGVGRGVEKIMKADLTSSILSKEMLPEFDMDLYGPGVEKGVGGIIKIFNESKVRLYGLPFNLQNMLIAIFTVASVIFILIYKQKA